VDVQLGSGDDVGPGDAPRPRVFDPDSGEVLGDAQPAVTAASAGSPKEPRTRAARVVLVVGVAIALGVGAAVGSVWQRHRDTARDRNEVHLSLALATSGGLNFSAGDAVLPVNVANSGSRPFTVTSLAVSGDGVTGRSAQHLAVAAGDSEQFVVGLQLPCGSAQLATLDASVDVIAAGGARRTITSALATDGAGLVSSCSTDEPFSGADAVVTRASGPGPTFMVGIRLTLPRGTPATQVSVTAVPFTADPAPVKTFDGTAPANITLSLNALNACVRSSSWAGLPTSFTVTATQKDSNEAQTDLTMPYALYRGLIHAVDADCPATSSTG
jgi:hypothetical protein